MDTVRRRPACARVCERSGRRVARAAPPGRSAEVAEHRVATTATSAENEPGQRRNLLAAVSPARRGGRTADRRRARPPRPRSAAPSTVRATSASGLSGERRRQVAVQQGAPIRVPPHSGHSTGQRQERARQADPGGGEQRAERQAAGEQDPPTVTERPDRATDRRPATGVAATWSLCLSLGHARRAAARSAATLSLMAKITASSTTAVARNCDEQPVRGSVVEPAERGRPPRTAARVEPSPVQSGSLRTAARRRARADPLQPVRTRPGHPAARVRPPGYPPAPARLLAAGLSGPGYAMPLRTDYAELGQAGGGHADRPDPDLRRLDHLLRRLRHLARLGRPDQPAPRST